MLRNLEPDSYGTPDDVFDFTLSDCGWNFSAGAWNVGGYMDPNGSGLLIAAAPGIHSGITSVSVYYHLEVADAPGVIYFFEPFHFPDWTPSPENVDQTTGGGPPMALATFTPNNLGPYNDGLKVQFDRGFGHPTVQRIYRIVFHH